MKNIFLFSALLSFISLQSVATLPVSEIPVPAKKAGNSSAQLLIKPDPGTGPITDADNSSTGVNVTALTISPNPATSYFDVYFSANQQGNTQVMLYDITGKLAGSVKQLPAGEKSLRIVRGNLPAGIYFLVVKNDAGQQCRRVIFS